jgi:hypothetical protein
VARLSRNDIKDGARAFAREWDGDSYERGEAQSFWTQFLQVFGVDRRRVNAAFEQHARRASTGGLGFIDLLWPGMLLAEHKSLGRDLDDAMTQALDYLDGLDDAQFPRFVVVSDFAEIRMLDLNDPDRVVTSFPLPALPDNIDRFLPLAGYTSRRFAEEEAVNVAAAELLGEVYDEIASTGYRDHRLGVFIVRVLFMLFGDDSGLWPRNQFFDLISNRTNEDGSDLGMWLGKLFETLDEPEAVRTTALDEDLAAFPYVNGGLFSEPIAPPDTTRAMRDRLLEACAFDWSQISPAIFGSMFQSVMDPEARHAIGAHYTTEENIMRVIRPLFLDDLEAELGRYTRKDKLRDFHEKLGSLRFFDPACGCGNFLVIAYRELRRLEVEVLQKLYPGDVQMTTLLGDLRRVTVDQFYGVELEEFPVRIAETAMYLMDHLANEQLGAAFGLNLVDLPLESSAKVVHGNAMRTDWASVLPPSECDYLLGNPPYLGKHLLSAAQRDDLVHVFGGARRTGSLDYVAGWFHKAKAYMSANTDVRLAFVATNSITQGEQVPILWPSLHEAGLHIKFAWRTFEWTSEARGRAHVHVVIIGLEHAPSAPNAVVFEEDPITGDVLQRRAASVNGYLVDAPEVYPAARSAPIADVVPVRYGSKPVDGGHLLLTADEAEEVRRTDAVAAGYIRPLMSATEFVNGEDRYCFWLEEAAPAEVRRSPELLRRLDEVRRFRLDSSKEQTRAAAATPGLFAEIRNPCGDFIFVPIHVSSQRRLIPMGFVTAEQRAVVHNSGAFIENADLVLFGILQSELFATWQGMVGGRIKSDFRFNNRLVYNTFPFPKVSGAARNRVEEAATEVLAARANHPTASLADLYSPLSAPADLVRAHRGLDRAVEGAYGRRRALHTDADRLPLLIDKYLDLNTGQQLPGMAAERRRRR